MHPKSDDAGPMPFSPLLGYAIAVFGDMAVTLKLEFAQDVEEMRAGITEKRQFVLSPDIAMALGRDLIHRAELAMKASEAPAQ